MRILDWRANEIMMSRHLAECIERPHYTLAVKHPFESLSGLVFSDKGQTVYLSHPISEPRRLEQKEDTIARFNEYMDEQSRLETKLQSEFTCFFPTTIDEFRIKSKKVEEKPVFLPKLLPRWQKSRFDSPSGVLFQAPKGLSTKDPLWDADEDSGLSFLIRSVRELIKHQISSRDHKLVEQSQLLIVYRPCFNGNPSEGVLVEISYFRALQDQDDSKQCFMLVPTQDQNRLRVKQFESRINNQIKLGYLVFEDDVFTLNDKLADALIDAGDLQSAVIDVFDDVVDQQGLEIAEMEASPVAGDKADPYIEYKRKLIDEYLSNVGHFLKQYTEVATKFWEEDDMSPEKFVDSVVSALNKPEENKYE